MNTKDAQSAWKKIVDLVEDKLQMGLLEQIRCVVDIKLEGPELTLYVATDDAFEFFSSPVNQQRLIIISGNVISLEKVHVEKTEANPIFD